MTISSTNRKAGPFIGNDSAVDFPFTFKVFATADVLVVRANSEGVETELDLDTDYTVALNADQDANPGGTVTLPTELATGSTLIISSAIENLQPAQLSGAFYPKVINNSLDRLTILVQQLAGSVSRSLKTAITTPNGVITQLPAPVPYALIGWNADGDGFRNSDPSGAAGLAPDLYSTSDGKGAELVGYLPGGTGAVGTTVQSKLREFVSVKDFGAVGDGVADDYAALQSAADWANSTGGTVLVPHTDSFYAVSNGIFIYAGKWVFEQGALIKNVADDGTNFWANTAVFIGSYFGHGAADGITAETAYEINPAGASDKDLIFVTAADSDNFAAGDVVYIADANAYTSTTFPIASHVTEVISAAAGELKMRDALPMSITANGATKPTVRKASNAITTADVGKPSTTRLARNVVVENGQFESVRDSWAQVVHIACHDSNLHFASVKGAELLGINPCSYSQIEVEKGLYHVRAFELAYHHSYVKIPIIRARRDKLPTPDTKASIPFIVSEYGNNVECGVIDINDENWANDQGYAAVGFSAPYNRAQSVRVVGSQNAAVVIGNGLDRAQGTEIDSIHVVKSINKGVIVDCPNVSIGHVAVDDLPNTAGELAVEVKSGATGISICSANLGKGVGNGQRFRIDDANGAGSGNKYGSIISHYTQVVVRDRGLTAVAGTGADNTLKTYTVGAGKSTKHGSWKFRFTGNIPAGSTSAAKTLSLKVNGTSVASISLSAAQTGFVVIDADLMKAGSNTQLEYVASVQSAAGHSVGSGTLAINTETTALTASLVANMGASDTLNVRVWDVTPSGDQFNF